MCVVSIQVGGISIHALLAESDAHRCTTVPNFRHFYPRSPCGERPNSQQGKNNGHEFLSTLSLRRATCEMISIERCSSISIHALLAESDERANRFPNAPPQISIHALLAESDGQQCLPYRTPRRISIHALLAESDPLTSRAKAIAAISIHALLAESDPGKLNKLAGLKLVFLSTLSLRRATSGYR